MGDRIQDFTLTICFRAADQSVQAPTLGVQTPSLSPSHAMLPLLSPDHQSRSSIDAMKSLMVHPFSTPPQQHMQPPVPEARLLLRQPIPPASSAAAHPCAGCDSDTSSPPVAPNRTPGGRPQLRELHPENREKWRTPAVQANREDKQGLHSAR
jgi:hypothetical protein